MIHLENLINEAVNSDRPTMLMFYSKNDKSSREEMPVEGAAAGEMSGKAHFFQIDGDFDTMLRDKYNVKGYPTFVLIRDGQEVWRNEGRLTFAEIRNMVNKFV